MKTNQERNAFAQIMQLMTARWISEPLYVAAHLGIADLIADKEKTVKELAHKTGSHAPYLYRVLRALASMDIFRETEKNTFENTPLSECLKKNVMQPLANFFLSKWHNKAWDKLYESVITGKNAFYMAHGMSAFNWLNDHPDEAAAFHKANELKIRNLSNHIVKAYDFSGYKTIADIGSGTGILMVEILKANPHVKGILADLPITYEEAEKNIKMQNLESRCIIRECDFFSSIPENCDLYIVSNILHDWDDEHCTIILNNCQKVMKKNSILLIMEMIVPKANEPSVAKLLDLEVLVMGGGKERTINEFQKLLQNAGFHIHRIIETGLNEKLMECVCTSDKNR